MATRRDSQRPDARTHITHVALLKSVQTADATLREGNIQPALSALRAVSYQWTYPSHDLSLRCFPRWNTLGLGRFDPHTRVDYYSTLFEICPVVDGWMLMVKGTHSEHSKVEAIPCHR